MKVFAAPHATVTLTIDGREVQMEAFDLETHEVEPGLHRPSLNTTISGTCSLRLISGVGLLHEHAFDAPVEGERARYACRCGAQAIKDLRTGELKLAKHRAPVDPRVQVTQPHNRIDDLGHGRSDALAEEI